MNQFEVDIKSAIKQSLSRFESNVFDDLYHLFQSYFERSCGNMMELRKRTQKTKGECFEVFCSLFLKEKGYNSWLLSELTEQQRQQFNLGRQDVGIDIVAEKNGDYFPVQCKFRKPTKDCKGRQVHRVMWRDLSTFLSLCERTGGEKGWKKHIIMTNADYCCWKGKKSNKDYTIGKKTFQKQERNFWYNMVFKTDKRENNETVKVESRISARELRQKWLDNINNSNK